MLHLEDVTSGWMLQLVTGGCYSLEDVTAMLHLEDVTSGGCYRRLQDVPSDVTQDVRSGMSTYLHPTVMYLSICQMWDNCRMEAC